MHFHSITLSSLGSAALGERAGHSVDVRRRLYTIIATAVPSVPSCKTATGNAKVRGGSSRFLTAFFTVKAIIEKVICTR